MHNRNTEELYFRKGDAPDPTGQSSQRGTEVGMDLTSQAMAKVQVRYQNRSGDDAIMDCEIYEVEGALSMHMLCPKCERGLRVTSVKKRIELSGQRISIGRDEPGQRIGCSWGDCDWRVVIKDNIARDV